MIMYIYEYSQASWPFLVAVIAGIIGILVPIDFSAESVTKYLRIDFPKTGLPPP